MAPSCPGLDWTRTAPLGSLLPSDLVRLMSKYPGQRVIAMSGSYAIHLTIRPLYHCFVAVIPSIQNKYDAGILHSWMPL